MKPQKIATQTPLRDLVLKVHHLELAECNTFEDSKEVIRLMVKNIEAVLQALACFAPPNRRIERAADLLKLKGARLLKLCSEMPEEENGSEEWRRIARGIIVNYDQFRIEAGMLYELVVPGATFSVLRAAL
jgi:hypothetical protein